jgi:hypothetical protein
MSDTLARIQNLVAREEIRISDHGYDELERMVFLSVKCWPAFSEPSWWKTTRTEREGRAF